MTPDPENRGSTGIRTIGVTGVAALAFLLVLSATGQANHWLARILIIGSLLLWAVMTWHVYQKD